MSNRALATNQKAAVPALKSVGSAALQRQCACGEHTIGGQCEECTKKHSALQRHPAEQADPAAVPPIVYEVLRSPGQPLDPETRAFMEPRFGHDFSKVRVHTDARAAESARAVDALAYTVGRDIVFGVMQYAPRQAEGQRLLAHELTHVVQQGGGDASDAPKAISLPDDVWEREAATVVEAVAAGRSSRPTSLTGPAVHRRAPATPPATLAGLTATRAAFNNSGAPDPANCAPLAPTALGVDGPGSGRNGMEMTFQISGAIPAGTEFDITRTRRTGTWQRNTAGAWSRLGGDPAGTNDDHNDNDECLTPTGGRIFVVDTPGMWSLNPRGASFNDGTTVSAIATAAVRKHSFAEWVIARNRPLGIDWVAISKPMFHLWHSVVSVELVGGAWTRVDTPGGQHNEIALGSIPTTGAVP